MKGSMVTREGMTAEDIAVEFLGDAGMARDVLRQNPLLTDYDDVFPAGIVVTLPEAAKESPKKGGVKLWD